MLTMSIFAFEKRNRSAATSGGILWCTGKWKVGQRRLSVKDGQEGGRSGSRVEVSTDRLEDLQSAILTRSRIGKRR